MSSISCVYVTGWVKRGPRGVIGTNGVCAAQVVQALWDDHIAGLLNQPVIQRESLRKLLDGRHIVAVGWDGWRAIDIAERTQGVTVGRPRVKLVTRDALVSAARG